ncbi:MAG TPA: hypothetical protein DCS07_13790 [Bdellovibrionales bacterium]|nr:MAG: hypothetical protein A2X97_12460 [Bdellovibrionales bacterium GWA1_52_35]HAR43681.1 hypothetical protein [Bdellovibrionales bacterium]HCM41660.1 hypothetical protein [Bdellovibrionales bacterium]
MRPKKRRHTCCDVNATYFKPRGIPMSTLEEVVLEPDEIEALRLAHLQSLYQEDAALRMKISRTTFSRIIDSAHKKVSDAIVNGKALRLDQRQQNEE